MVQTLYTHLQNYSKLQKFTRKNNSVIQGPGHYSKIKAVSNGSTYTHRSSGGSIRESLREESDDGNGRMHRLRRHGEQDARG